MGRMNTIKMSSVLLSLSLTKMTPTTQGSQKHGPQASWGNHILGLGQNHHRMSSRN